MDHPHLRIAIIGHVDHGKSTLIGRLLLDTYSVSAARIKEIGKGGDLAHLADQFKEEREGNMTLDTTQLFFRVHGNHYTVIDSPGHADLIKNMLTGATQADTAILIVDIMEGIREQTQRHAYLVDMLGIRNMIIVLNKMDLANYKENLFTEKKGALLEFFENLSVKPLNVIPVSVKNGVNISKKSSRTGWYKGPTLIEALAAIAPEVKPTRAPLRFPIQDIYEISGKKIAVGQILSGQITAGQKVTLAPSLKNTRVESIKVFGKPLRKAASGENIGVTLKDSLFAARGAILSGINNAALPVHHFTGNVFWLSEAPLRINAAVPLRCATQELSGRVTAIKNRMNSATLEIVEKDARQLNVNEAGLVSFTTERPIVIERFARGNGLGRFVVGQNLDLQGAGIIP